ncbi:MAG TPA: MBL fold metallo-hydrolase [Pyrinomonadaceae bacterium]|nr:MBL fold metallo-hydrolase [Pyrinomonadaceae bacterium]
MLRLPPCLLAAVCLLTLPTRAAAQSEKFDVVRVAEGVYAAVRRDSPGLAAEANNVFIVNSDDVVVVDTNISPSSTKEVLAALRALTPKPVRYVVNTHWHDDHVIGNQVYREAFPGVEFVAHETVREYLPGLGLERRRQALAGVPGYLDALRARIEKGQNVAGQPLTEEERAGYLNDIKIGERFVAEAPGAQNVLPTLTVADRLTLHRVGRTIDIRYLGRGHTAGDLVVHLPAENIVITGDLVVWPVPYVGGEQSHVGEWAATLGRVLGLRPAVIIPGHGPVLRDTSYVKLLAEMFASVKRQTDAAVARGETLEQARRSVNLEEFRKQLAGESQFRNVLFRSYVAGPAVAAAFREAKAAP